MTETWLKMVGIGPPVGSITLLMNVYLNRRVTSGKPKDMWITGMVYVVIEVR